MTDALAHRGPDGRGIFRKEYADGCGVALGHRRLAIIDVAGGQQPMTNFGETVFVTFNGEIYNYQELRRTLEGLGYRFRTQSDTETIVHAYEAFGENFVDHLRGMFAIGLWDASTQKLILARDRLGEKPLAFCHERERILFASEIKALQRISGIGTRLRPEAVDQYIRYGYIPHPWTAYQGIEKLAPGHIGVYQKGSWKIRRYWQPDLSTDDSISFDDACDQLTHAMEDSIKICMRSDVPLGAFLSGGMDSSIVAGIMQQHASSPIQTFNLAFPRDEFQETAYATRASKQLGTDHRKFTLERSSLDSLEQLVEIFDEPFADSSAIATYSLSQWTRSFVRTVLTGDGGDELFGGYARYQTIDQIQKFDRLPLLLKRILTGPWVNWIPTTHPEGLLAKLKHRMTVLRKDPHDRYSHWISIFSRYQREMLYQPDYLRSHCFDECDQFLGELMDRYVSQQPGIRAMRTDMHSYLPCDILAKVDITSMAHGLECRSPFMDHRLIETVSKFPFPVLHHSRWSKPVLGKTFGHFLPEDAMKRRKIGFHLPASAWNHPEFITMAQDLLRSPRSFCQDYIRTDAIERMLREHATGYMNHGERLWSLIFLESWGSHLPRRLDKTSSQGTHLDHPIATTISIH
jgi:asparagine synthase (glutamine-hydrolysing)